jgi:TP901 family phage tail tape measure protein
LEWFPFTSRERKERIVVSAVTELEKLVIRIVGDVDDYIADMDAAEKYAKQLADDVERSAQKSAEALKEAEAAQALFNKALERGEQIARSVATPSEAYADQMRELDALLKLGSVSQETYNRAQAKYKDILDQSLPEFAEQQRLLKQQEESLKRGTQLTNALLTPQERYEQNLKEINGLLTQGHISHTTYTRAVSALDQEMSDLNDTTTATISKMQNVGSVVTSTGAGIAGIGTALTVGITAPVIAMGGYGVKAFGDFDKAMTESLAIMDTTEDQVTRMKEAAISLGTQGIQGPEKMAQSYYFLASAGLDAEQSIAALPQVSAFATAGAFDMEKATSLLTDANSALGLASTDAAKNLEGMARVSDVLTRSGILANASVEQLAISMTSKAGAALRVVNKDIEEGAAVLSAFAAQGIKAEVAGNALDRMIRLLSESALKNADEHKRLGLAVFDSSGSMRNMADIVENLEQILMPLTVEQRAATMAMMGFQAEVQQVISPLLGTSAAIRKYEADLRNAGGTTADVAAKQLTSFNNQIAILWNKVSAAAIIIGAALAPAILMLNTAIQYGLDWWISMNTESQQMIMILAGIAAMVGPLVAAFGLLLTSIGGVITMVAGFAAVGTATLVVAAKIIAAVLAVVAVFALVTAAIAGLIYWIVGPEGIANAWNTATSAVSSFVSNAIGFLANFRMNIVILLGWFKENWGSVLTDVGSMYVQAVANMVSNTMTVLHTLFRLWTAWQGFMYGIFRSIFSVDFVKAVWEGIKIVATAFIDFAKNAWKAIKSIFSGREVTMSDFLGQMQSDFEGGSKDFLGTAKGILQDGLKDLKGPLDGFESSIKEGPSLVLDTVKEMQAQVDKVDKIEVPSIDESFAVEATADIAKLDEITADVAKVIDTQVSTQADVQKVAGAQTLAGIEAGSMEALLARQSFESLLPKYGPVNTSAIAPVGDVSVAPKAQAAAQQDDGAHKEKMVGLLSAIVANTKNSIMIKAANFTAGAGT